MLFPLPANTISGITGFIFDFFDATKIYIFLAIGVGLGLLIIDLVYDLFFGREIEEDGEFNE